jgi:hypothetical protein
MVNDDVNVRCFIVQLGDFRFKMRMMDFGHTRFRRHYPSEEDWRYWEAEQDGEGAVGIIMERKLAREYGGGYVYRRTPWCEALVRDYLSEP